MPDKDSIGSDVRAFAFARYTHPTDRHEEDVFVVGNVEKTGITVYPGRIGNLGERLVVDPKDLLMYCVHCGKPMRDNKCSSLVTQIKPVEQKQGNNSLWTIIKRWVSRCPQPT